ncbi:MAG TPA: hypothetical protein V6C89_20925 [Drouetiella sp.]|jgi:hypothetical protein
MQLKSFIRPGNLLKTFARTTFVVASLGLLATWLFSVSAQPASARSTQTGSEQRYDDGVTVRKNADGTVETFDSSSAPEAIAQQPNQIVRRPVISRAYSKVIGGVHVRRNSDGTIETYEPMSKPVPLYPTSHPVRSHKAHK